MDKFLLTLAIALLIVNNFSDLRRLFTQKKP